MLNGNGGTYLLQKLKCSSFFESVNVLVFPYSMLCMDLLVRQPYAEVRLINNNSNRVIQLFITTLETMSNCVASALQIERGWNFCYDFL